MDVSKFGLLHHQSSTVRPGDRFGSLTILAIGRPIDSYRYTAVCRCDCGTEHYIARLDGIKSGAVRGCGCVQRASATKHGLSKNPLFDVWKNMRDRCSDPL